MVWNLLIPAAASIFGASQASNSAKKSAQATQDASAASIAEQARQYDLARKDQMPFLQGGYQRLNAQNSALGLGAINYNSTGQSGLNYEDYVRNNPDLLNAFNSSGGQYGSMSDFGKTHWDTWGQNQGFAAPQEYSNAFATGESNGQSNNPLSGFQSSAYYQLPRDPNYLNSVNTMYSAKGMGLDGAAQKAMFDRISNQDYNRFTDYMTTLSGGIASGQGSASNLGSLGANMANQNSQSRQQTANALASSYNQSSNAWGNAAGDIAYGVGRYGQKQGWF